MRITNEVTGFPGAHRVATIHRIAVSTSNGLARTILQADLDKKVTLLARSGLPVERYRQQLILGYGRRLQTKADQMDTLGQIYPQPMGNWNVGRLEVGNREIGYLGQNKV